MPSRVPVLPAAALGVALSVAVAVTVGVWLDGRSEAAPPAQAAAAAQSGQAAVSAVDPSQTPIPLDRMEAIPATVYLSPTCGCCSGWVDHMTANGFQVDLQYREDIAAVKEEVGVRSELSSCHTAIVNGYVVEGHVPADVVRRLLAEAPPVKGITAPGMPVGSPGMEMGDLTAPYDVMTFTSDGRTAVYSSHGRN